MKKLNDIELPQNRGKLKRFKVRLPSMTGKFGLALFIGKKEVFIGVAVNEVEIEQVVRKRFIKAPSKGKVNVFNFDTED